jgi:hypothetical protein
MALARARYKPPSNHMSPTINVRQNHNCLYLVLYSGSGRKTRGAEEQYQSLNVEASTVLRETDALDATTRRQQCT